MPGNSSPLPESSEEITGLIRRVQSGRDEGAVEQLWNAYYHRLVEASKRYLGDLPKRVADEEDVALSGLDSFFRAAETGQLAGVGSRDELWRVLLTITVRKANRHKERAMAQKRGGGGIARGESGFFPGRGSDPTSLPGIPDSRMAANLVAECRERISSLPDDTLKKICVLRLKGWTVEDIAEELSVALSTIKRKVRRIREIWSRQETD